MGNMYHHTLIPDRLDIAVTSWAEMEIAQTDRKESYPTRPDASFFRAGCFAIAGQRRDRSARIGCGLLNRRGWSAASWR